MHHEGGDSLVRIVELPVGNQIGVHGEAWVVDAHVGGNFPLRACRPPYSHLLAPQAAES